jgi:PAS domain S-box-containing protein
MFKEFLESRAFPQLLRAFVVAMLVSFLIGAALFIQRSYSQTKAAVENTATREARRVSLYLADVLTDAGHALSAITGSVSNSKLNGATDVTQQLAAIVGERDYAISAAVLDSRGKVIAQWARSGAPRKTVSYGGIVDALRERKSRLAADQILVSAPDREAIDQSANIVVSKRIPTADGNFAGVSLLELNGAKLLETLQAVSGDPATTIAVADGEGRLLLSRPAAPPYLTHYPAFQTLPKSLTSEVEGVSPASTDPVDGLARVVGYRFEPLSRLTTYTGVSREQIISVLSWQVPIIVLLFLAVAATVLVLLQLMLRQFQELREREQSVAMSDFALKNTAEFVAWIEADGRLRLANEAFRKALGYEASEISGLYVWSINRETNRKQWVALWERLGDLGSDTRDAKVTRKDGSFIEVEIVMSRLDFRGEEVGFMLLHDVTERNRTWRSLRESQEREKVQLAAFADHREFVSIGMMSATILHDIKHEVGHAVQRSELLKRELSKGDSLQHEALQRHLGLLAHNFDLVVALLDEVKGRLHNDHTRQVGRVSLREAAKQVQFFKAEILSKARTSIDVRNLNLSVNAVHEDVVHILFNLVQNSADALIAVEIDHPSIVVGAEQVNGKWVRISVEDNGCGFDNEADAEGATPTGSQKPGGWGRGLEICRWLISRYDGAKFWTENKAGGGAIVHFTLPLDETQ